MLVADDNAATRELVRVMLSAVGARVTLANDGVEVVAAAAVRAYDVILMDIRMPGQDGEMALRRIRAHPGANRSTPILAFSADTELTPQQTELFDGLVQMGSSHLDLLVLTSRSVGPRAGRARCGGAGTIGREGQAVRELVS